MNNEFIIVSINVRLNHEQTFFFEVMSRAISHKEISINNDTLFFQSTFCSIENKFYICEIFKQFNIQFL